MKTVENVRENLAGFLVVIVGILAFAIVVYAETSDTTVTITNATPSITAVSLGNQLGVAGDDITLSESTFVWATATVSIQDTNSCQDITTGGSVVAKAYYTLKAGTTGTLCTPNDVTCLPDTYYHACTATTTGSGTCTGPTDTTVQYDCGFKFWFVASSSDAGTYDSSDLYVWAVAATATDNAAATGFATNSGQTVDVVALVALNDTISALAYGSLAPGDDSSAQTFYATSTGNVPIDVNLHESDTLNSGANVIDPEQQTYALSAGGWAAGTPLTSGATRLEAIIVQNSATTSLANDQVFWYLRIPAAQPTGSYSGQTTVSATLD